MGIKHVLSINDFTGEQIFEEVLPRCEEKISFIRKRIPLEFDRSKKVQLAFFEPSTRTRGSNAEAAEMQGYRIDQVIGGEATSLVKKETLANTARMFAKLNAGIIIMRTGIEGAQKFIAELLEAEGYECAVHNAGDGGNQHPTQAFLDLLTIKMKLKRLDNFKIGFFGDLKYGRTVHSLLTALSHRENIKVVLVQSEETALQKRYLRLFPDVQIAENMRALEYCDVIYGARIQEERFNFDPMALEKLRRTFTITPELLTLLKESAVIMHPMPYVQEFPANVRGNKKIVIDDQAWCGVPTRAALQEMSFQNLGQKVFVSDFPGAVLEVIEQCSLDEYWQRRGGRKTKGEYFNPIGNGTVVDKIPAGLGFKVKQFLIKNYQLIVPGPIHLIDKISETALRGGKEVLILRNNFVDKETKILVGSWAPTITFNEIREGRFTKTRVKDPVQIRGFGKCPNKNCITNNDPEAAAKFIHSDGGLRCWYCEKEFDQSQIV